MNIEVYIKNPKLERNVTHYQRFVPITVMMTFLYKKEKDF